MLTHHMQQLKSSTHSDIEDMCMIQIQVCTISKVDKKKQKQVDLLMPILL